MQANFHGSVSAQAEPSEIVQVTITKPDGTFEIAVASTQADGTFSVIREYSVAGTYKAKAHVDADAIYSAWDSDEVTFSILLTPRTGMFSVDLS